MAETQLKLAEAEENIYWLALLRSPGRGGSVCRHSWTSDLSTSVSFSLSVSISISLSPTLVASVLLLSACRPHSLFLQKAKEKVAISPQPMVFSAEDPRRKGLVSLPAPSSVFTYQIIWKAQMEHSPPLNQSQ